jgi:predicted adenylyl cyclase CyaB
MVFRNKEIEIKVRIGKPDRLVSFLKKNAKRKGVLRQVDEYFVPAHRNFVSAKPIKEWLRLRSENGVCTINYKYFHYDNQGLATEADEFETQVNDIKQVRKIFAALNLRPIVKVDKTRQSWFYKNY